MCISGNKRRGLNKLHKRSNYQIRRQSILWGFDNITFIDQKSIQGKPVPLEGSDQRN